LKITIIGCGWLGLQVGKSLSREGHDVFGSHRSSERKKELEESLIKGFELDLNLKSQISTSIKENTDALVFSLPPVKKEDPDYYASLLVNCAHQFPDTTRVIFTSSIGVYPHKEGRFNEDYIFQESEENSLLNAESELRKLLGNRLTILRLGGLIGPGRHPIKSLQGKSISHDGSTPINLIHSEDICLAINAILAKDSDGKCYNLVFPTEISKKKYYSSMIEKYELKSILFGIDKALNRTIDGSLICNNLDFTYSLDPQNYNSELE